MAHQFEEAAMDFAFRLFTRCFSEDSNTLVSPLSVSLALGMVLNGAKGATEEEIRRTVAGDLSPEDYRKALTAYVNALPSDEKAKFHFANSVWIEKAFRLRWWYEKSTEKQFRAVIERLPFDEEAVRKINDWVKRETDGMIDSVIDSATPEAALYLINALAFDAEWAEIYKESEIGKERFQNLNGTKTEVDAMRHTERIYLKAEGCTGFVKPYAGSRYSFVALLPDEEENASEFIRGFTAEKYLKILNSRTLTEVDTMVPKFECDYASILNETLSELGMGSAFGPDADFSGMSPDRISIGEVIHKTHIEVDERGTKAGAVTAVMMKNLCIPTPKPEVILNRPFVYAIADNEKLLPLFIGAVTGL